MFISKCKNKTRDSRKSAEDKTRNKRQGTKLK